MGEQLPAIASAATSSPPAARHSERSEVELVTFAPIGVGAARGGVGGCVSWRQTGGCSPDGVREPDKDKVSLVFHVQLYRRHRPAVLCAPYSTVCARLCCVCPPLLCVSSSSLLDIVMGACLHLLCVSRAFAHCLTLRWAPARCDRVV